MKQVIIIGSGPAGISAALYLQRSGTAEVMVLAKGTSALEKAEKIENFYGFSEPVTGAELHRRGIEGAKRLGVTFIEEQVVSLTLDEQFRPVVGTDKQSYTADALLLAMGASRQSANIKGLKELEGRGVSYCAVCDAFFYRGKEVAVLGSGAYAVHEAMVLADTAKSVTILTDGAELTAEVPAPVKVISKKLQSVNGKDKVESVTFADGSVQPFSGIFVALGVAGSIDLARKVGVEVEKNRIVVNDSMQTNIPCIFAAGDCTGGVMQVSKAVADGAKAGLAIIRFLKQ